MTASEGTSPRDPAPRHEGGGRGPTDRSVAEMMLDLFVYAPAGALLTAASDMPAMAAKGRQRIEQELRNAHLVGRIVVHAGARARGPLDWLVGEIRSHDAAAPAPPLPRRVRPTADPAAGAPGRDAAVDRAIPDYDTLSASQVVRRLDGLHPRELRAVVAHELANRGRRTIVHRAEQLLGQAPAAPPTT